MATLHEGTGGKQFLLVKGAPEVILGHCDLQLTSDGQQTPIDREHFNKASDKLASQGEASWRWHGLRILASRQAVLPPRTCPKLWCFSA